MLSEGVCERDIVFNVVFEVKDVGKVVDIVKRNDGRIIRGLKIFVDINGKVEFVVIGIFVGNVVYILLNVLDYKGVFLLGFNICDNMIVL